LLVSASTISKLRMRPKLWALRRIRAGLYGPAVLCARGALHVDLAHVEAAEGQVFTPEQVAAASGARVVVIASPEPETS